MCTIINHNYAVKEFFFFLYFCKCIKLDAWKMTINFKDDIELILYLNAL